MKNLPNGTPKTLIEAIANGITHGNPEVHVKDWIRQRLGVAFMRAGDDQNKLNWLYEVGALLQVTEKIEKPADGYKQKLDRAWDAIQDLAKAQGE